MKISLADFKGMMPKAVPSALPSSAAQVATDVDLTRQTLAPLREPEEIEDLGTDIQTMFLYDDDWIGFSEKSQVARGPVASKRLYISNGGEPQIRVDDDQYDLALPYPSDDVVPTAAGVAEDEQIIINGTGVSVTEDTSGTIGAIDYDVTIDGRKATFELTPTSGESWDEDFMADLVDGLGYVNNDSDPAEGEKIFTITELVDDGDDSDSGSYNTSSLALESVVSVYDFSDSGNFDEYDEEDSSLYSGLEYTYDYEKLKIGSDTFVPTIGYTGSYLDWQYTITGASTAVQIEFVYIGDDTGSDVTDDLVTVLNSLRYLNYGGEHKTTDTKTITLTYLYDAMDDQNENYIGLSAHVYVSDDFDSSDNATYTTADTVTSKTYTYDDDDEVEDPSPFVDGLSRNYKYLQTNSTTVNITPFVIDDITTWTGDLSSNYIKKAIVLCSNLTVHTDDQPPLLVSRIVNPNYDLDSDNSAIGTTVYPFEQTEASTVDLDQTFTKLKFTVENLANGNAGEDIAESIYYCYTWVSKYSEESLPSEPTDIFTWDADMKVKISNFDTPPDDSRIETMRLYRSSTDSSTSTTEFYYIDERDVSEDDWEDDQLDLVDELPSEDYDDPPDDLKFLTTMSNGMMAGMSDQQVCFCEPYIPHAWPEDYQYAIDRTAMGLVAVGTSLIIITDEKPILMQGTYPDSMIMQKMGAVYPESQMDSSYSCLSEYGIAGFGGGAAYPSNDGLALATTNGVTIITKGIITPEQWQAYNPSSFVAGQYRGMYIATYSGGDNGSGTMFITYNGQEAYITTSDIVATDWFYDVDTGNLYYLDSDGKVQQFNSPDEDYKTATWRSKVFNALVPMTFSCCYIDVVDTSKSFSLKIYCDDTLVDTVTDVNQIKRFAAAKGKNWEFEASCDGMIKSILVASSPDELSASSQGGQ